MIGDRIGRIIAGFLVIIFMCSCRDEPGKKFIEENEKGTDQNLSEVMKQSDTAIMKVVKKDWGKFKKESEVVIINTENQIKQLREKISKSEKIEHKIVSNTLDSLDHKNKKLKERIAQRAHEFKQGLIAFNAEAREMEQKFEKDFKRDMDEIKRALQKIVTPDDSIIDQ